MQKDKMPTSAILPFPARLLLLVSSHLQSVEGVLRKEMKNAVITSELPAYQRLHELVARHDVLLSDLEFFESTRDDLSKIARASQIPLILLISHEEEKRLLADDDTKSVIWDYIFFDELRKLSFSVNKYYEFAGQELNSLNADDLRFKFRIKKLTEQNLMLMDQLSEKENLLKQHLENEYSFRSMVEESGDVVYSSNYKGEFTYINPRVEALTGYKAEELIGRNYLQVVHPDERSEVENFYFTQFREKIEETVKDFAILRKNGEKKWVEQTVRLVMEGNLVKGFHCIVRDIDERKRYEQKLQEHASLLEKTNRELELFTYIASHDLKEPLRKITTFSSRIQALPELKNLSEKGKDYLGRLNAATKRMEGLIEDLLAYSRVSRKGERFRQTDLNEVFTQVLTEMEPAIKSSGASITANGLISIVCIETQIRNLLVNLLSNSMKFSRKEAKPEIKVEGTVIRSEKVPCLTQEQGCNYLRLTVMDNGIGFDNKYNTRIFDIFQRLHGRSEYPGTGVGLAIVKKIAERHNGCVTADGKPGEGATFNVYLPIDFRKIP